MAFNGLQAVLRPVQPGMAVEGEADELPQLPGLEWAHDLLTDALEVDAVCRPAGLGVGIQVLKILLSNTGAALMTFPVWLSRRTPKLPKCRSSL